jgi:hypothetical protein
MSQSLRHAYTIGQRSRAAIRVRLGSAGQGERQGDVLE